MALLWHPETDAFVEVDDEAAKHHHQSGWMPAADREAFLADQAARASAPKSGKSEGKA